MKKYIQFFIFIFMFFSYSPIIYADCSTGFACSIADLEKKEQEQFLNDLKIMKNFMQKQNNYNHIINYKTIPKDYNDIFIFNTIF